MLACKCGSKYKPVRIVDTTWSHGAKVAERSFTMCDKCGGSQLPGESQTQNIVVRVNDHTHMERRRDRRQGVTQ